MNRNKIFLHSAICFLLFVSVFLLYLNYKRYVQFTKIVSFLVVYEAVNDHKPLEMVRWGSPHDGGYVIPKILLEKSDVMFGYGIGNDICFESSFSKKYGKESFCFDGGVKNIETGSEKCHFFSECIGNDKHLYEDQKSSGKFSSYSEHIKRHKLENKKIFLKMDIEGAEFDVFDDILKHSNSITGIVLEIHFMDDDNIKKTEKLLNELNKDFLLVHVHGNNLCEYTFSARNLKNRASRAIELTYINRNIVDEYKVSNNQKHPTSLDRPNHPNLPDYEFEVLVTPM